MFISSNRNRQHYLSPLQTTPEFGPQTVWHWHPVLCTGSYSQVPTLEQGFTSVSITNIYLDLGILHPVVFEALLPLLSQFSAPFGRKVLGFFVPAVGARRPPGYLHLHV